MKTSLTIYSVVIFLVNFMPVAWSKNAELAKDVFVTHTGEVQVSDKLEQKCLEGQNIRSFGAEYKAYIFQDQDHDKRPFVVGCVFHERKQLVYAGRFAVSKKSNQVVGEKMLSGGPHFIELEDNITLHAVDPVYWHDGKLFVFEGPDQKPSELDESFEWVGGPDRQDTYISYKFTQQSGYLVYDLQVCEDFRLFYADENKPRKSTPVCNDFGRYISLPPIKATDGFNKQKIIASYPFKRKLVLEDGKILGPLDSLISICRRISESKKKSSFRFWVEKEIMYPIFNWKRPVNENSFLLYSTRAHLYCNETKEIWTISRSN